MVATRGNIRLARKLTVNIEKKTEKLTAFGNKWSFTSFCFMFFLDSFRKLLSSTALSIS